MFNSTIRLSVSIGFQKFGARVLPSVLATTRWLNFESIPKLLDEFLPGNERDETDTSARW
jgi:hypothetical protein